MKSLIIERVENQIENLQNLLKSDYIDCVEKAAEVIVAALNNGNKILVAGNGGSAADSQHFVAEIVGRFLIERRGLPAIALTTDSSILTCVGNDYDFDSIFSRQVEALACHGDVFVGISTSGNSKNILKAVEVAKSKNVVTIGMAGKDGGQLKEVCDYSIVVENDITARVQEAQELTYHIICEIIDKKVLL